jgi:hypothetical protein
MEFNKKEKIAYKKGYRVTNGKVYGLSVKTLSLKFDKKGYPSFTFVTGSRKDNTRKKHTMPVHRLLAYQKYGDIIYEDGIQTRHLDGNPSNFSESNIEIGTAIDNASDKDRNVVLGAARYAASFNKKWSDDEVKHIKLDRENGMKYTEIMNKWGMKSKGTVSYILKKR